MSVPQSNKNSFYIVFILWHLFILARRFLQLSLKLSRYLLKKWLLDNKYSDRSENRKRLIFVQSYF